MSEFQPPRRLGRGLNALMGAGVPAHEEVTGSDVGELHHIPVGNISRNPFQPRKDFDAESLAELASSVKEHGILQPLLVREADGGFQLIAGERRWQAAQKAGLATVPCRVVDVIDKTACEFALEENLKRKDLNDLEKAEAFKAYLAHFECSADELAKQLSMSRSAVSNILRLLELPDSVKNALHAGKLSAGHARALLPLEQADQLALAGRIQAESLSVRKTESLVREILGRPQPAAEAEKTAEVVSDQPASEETQQPTLSLEAAREEADELRTNHVISLEQQLTDLFGVKVQIKLKSKENGFIVIPFNSNTEFERILTTARRAG